MARFDHNKDTLYEALGFTREEWEREAKRLVDAVRTLPPAEVKRVFLDANEVVLAGLAARTLDNLLALYPLLGPVGAIVDIVMQYVADSGVKDKLSEVAEALIVVPRALLAPLTFALISIYIGVAGAVENAGKATVH